MLSAETYARAKRLFLAAGDLPTGERTQFIERACEGDQELETHVRKLLRSDREDAAFLEGSAMGSDLPALRPGMRLGRFELVHLLGEGGMGVVYEALEDEPARRVALKLIRPMLLSGRLRSRFRQEVRMLGLMQHPGITQVYAAGTLEWGGEAVPYLAMELIVGHPLLEYAREQSLDARARLILIAQICDAVHYAHQKGVIHRDLKPANILVAESPTTVSGDPGRVSGAGGAGGGGSPQVKILDFGVARAVDPGMGGATAQTDAGQLIGTLQYMSPEQVAGRGDGSAGGDVDVRSDVYAIGLVAYELLAGRPPYSIRGEALPEAARIIRDRDASRLGSTDRAFRGDVETIVARALEKDPARRYQSASEMGADIRRFMRDEPILARPSSPLYQLRKFSRRNRPLVVAGAAVIAIMIAGTAVSTWQARAANRASVIAEKQRELASVSAEAAQRESYRARLAAAAAAIDTAEPLTARQLLAGVDEGSRDWVWAYWNARRDQSVAVVDVGGRIVGAELVGDPPSLVAVNADGRILRGDPFSGRLREVGRTAKAPVSMGVFCNDGAMLIAATGEDGRSVGEFDAYTGVLIDEIAELAFPAGLLRASADGSTIVVAVRSHLGAAPGGDTWLWQRSAGRGPHQLTKETRASGLALSGDGRWLVRGYHAIEVWDTATLGREVTRRMARGFARVAVSDDGARIAFGGEDKLVRVWDRLAGGVAGEPAGGLGGVLRGPWRGHAGNISALAIDRAGGQIASAGVEQTIRIWDASTGTTRAVLAGHTALVGSLQFAGDGQLVLSTSGDGTMRLWMPEPEEGVSVLRGHDSYVYAVAFSADGDWIVSGSWDGTVRIWDAAGGGLVRMVRGEEPPRATEAEYDYITAVAISRDGAEVAAAHKVGEWRHPVIRLWRMDSWEAARELAPTRGRGKVVGLVYTPDGKDLLIACFHDGMTRMGLDGELRYVISLRGPRSMALSPDGREVAIGLVTGAVVIHDAETGEVLREIDAHDRAVRALAYSPDGRLLASGSADAAVGLWDASTGAAVGVLDGHWDTVYALAFSPDGRHLASGSDDTTIRIWSVGHGEELTQLRGHHEYIYSLAFSPDGSRLVSGSGDQTVRVWDTRPVHERWRARVAGRGVE